MRRFKCIAKLYFGDHASNFDQRLAFDAVAPNLKLILRTATFS